MTQNTGISTAVKVAAILAVIVIGIVVYSGLTFPREVTGFSVNFTIGATSEQRAFDVPFLDNAVQVKVAVSSGAALWTAGIIDSNGTTVWNHNAAQGEQNTYTSEWLTLASGRYNFTFATAGGALDARISVAAKGGFW